METEMEAAVEMVAMVTTRTVKMVGMVREVADNRNGR
jgi:hypothetical protein